MFYKRNRQGGISFTSQHPQHQSYRQFIRDPAIPALLGKIFTIKPNSTGEKDLEEYFCILSGLFVPWSNHHPFKPSFMTWRDFFEGQNLSPRHLRFIENIALLHKSQEEAKINRLQMKAQESHVFEDDEYEDLDEDEDEMHEGDWVDTPQQGTIEEAFLHSSETTDPYVNEAVDASLDYGYFELPADASMAPPDSIYYSSLPAKPLLDSIKPNAI